MSHGPERAPGASSPAVAKRMRSTPCRDSRPEIELRRRVHAAGLRYRVDVQPLRDLRRRADLVFPVERVAVFLDGCFWHGCPQHFSCPRANGRWWQAKIETTRLRDADTGMKLRAEGWLVLRFWEHESPIEAAASVVTSVKARRRAADLPRVSGPRDRSGESRTSVEC